MRSLLCRIVALSLLAIPALFAQPFEFFPGAKYDPRIPTLKAVVGHDHAERITMHHEAEKYIFALDQASPLIQIVRYAETWEGRALYYLIVASEANQARVTEIKAGMQKLADPRRISASEAETLIKSLPAITWLTYGVHGNEISSTDAALLLAYHLVAAQNDSLTKKILSNTVVIIDPMENPDGRDRYLTYLRHMQARWPDADPNAAEHNELWPSGRSNHYMFDMNRDWFANTQPETRGRTRIFLEWYPQVFVDLHEMGYNETYYFPPPALPHNPNMTAAQHDWLSRYGQNNAKWFDRFRFDYFTREVYDSFYPGYGEGWPIFQGAIGMTFEQAGADGLVIRRDDKTLLRYRDGVRHHFISSLSTAEVTANHREGMLRYFYDYRRTAIEEGSREVVKEYIIPPGNDPSRAARLAALLMQQGLEVKRAETSFTNPQARDYIERKLQSKNFPAGTFLVSLAQPGKRLLKTLMDRQTDMNPEFIKEQIQRAEKRQGDEIYDVTGWSLPLLHDVECYAAEAVSSVRANVLAELPKPQGKIGEPAHIGYLMAWGKNNVAVALADLLRQGVRVHSSDKEIVHQGTTYPRGSLFVKVKDNAENLHDRMKQLASAHGVEILSVNSSWVTGGVNFGSDFVKYVEPPRIAMAFTYPTSSLSAGWTRYVLEQMHGYPVTVVHTWQLASADLSEYNVLILPHAGGAFGGYGRMLGESGAHKLRAWMQNGGTLITIGEATRWLTEEKVDLLATSRELRGGKSEKKADKGNGGGAKAESTAAGFDLQKGIQPEEELPERTPGALMRVQLESTHWMTAGYNGFANVLVESSNIFTPLKLDKGVNVATYLPEDKILLSGFTWESARKQLGNKAFLMHQQHGGGQVIAFAEDPNYRAFIDGLNLLFMNAVLLGPAHAR